MSPLPHVRKSTLIQRDGRSVVTGRYFQGSWKKCALDAYLAQQFETFLSGPWQKIGPLQCLVRGACQCQFHLMVSW